MAKVRRPVYFSEVIQAIATLQVLGAYSSRNAIINEVINSRKVIGKVVPDYLPGKIHQVVYYGICQGILKQSIRGNVHLAVGTRYLSSLCKAGKRMAFASACNCKGKRKLRNVRKAKLAATKATASACKTSSSATSKTMAPKPTAFSVMPKPASAVKSIDVGFHKNTRKRNAEKNDSEIPRKVPHA